MLKIALCDSDLIHLKELEQLVDDYLIHEEHSVYCFGDSAGILSYLEGILGLIDILFINMTLDDADGLAAVKTVAEYYPSIKIIAFSDSAERMEELFLYRPAFFLFRPVHKDSLEKCLKRIVEDVQRTSYQFLSYSGKSGIINILYHSILYVESNKRTVTIFEKETSHCFYEKLDVLQQKLGSAFLRCHKSYLVNMDQIQSFLSDSILLYNGKTIPVSQNKYSEAKRQFIHYTTYKMR